MHDDKLLLDDDPGYVWRRSIATTLMLVAAGFAYFALSAARMLQHEGVERSYGITFMALSLLLAGSSIASWFGRWWLTAGILIASVVVFVIGMPDR